MHGNYVYVHKINIIFASLFQTYLQMKCLQKLHIICYNSVCNLALKMRLHGTIVLNLKLRIHLKIDSQKSTA